MKKEKLKEEIDFVAGNPFKTIRKFHHICHSVTDGEKLENSLLFLGDSGLVFELIKFVFHLNQPIQLVVRIPGHI